MYMLLFAVINITKKGIADFPTLLIHAVGYQFQGLSTTHQFYHTILLLSRDHLKKNCKQNPLQINNKKTILIRKCASVVTKLPFKVTFWHQNGLDECGWDWIMAWAALEMLCCLADDSPDGASHVCQTVSHAEKQG